MARQGALRRRFGPAAVAAAMVGAVVVGTVVTGTATPASAADSPGGGNGDSGANGGSGNGGSGHGGHSATRAAMAALVRAQGLPGTIVGVQEGQDSWSAAVGVADTATGRPRSPRERFRTGSLTKTFTATAVLQLRAEGRLGLDDPVEKWLPGVVRGNGNDGSAITIRQLLGHTSGLFSFDEDPTMIQRLATPDFLVHRYDTYRPEDLVRTARPSAAVPAGNVALVLQHQLPPGRDDHRPGDRPPVRPGDRAADPPAARPLRDQPARHRRRPAPAARARLLHPLRGLQHAAGDHRTQPVLGRGGRGDDLHDRRPDPLLLRPDAWPTAAAGRAGRDDARHRRPRTRHRLRAARLRRHRLGPRGHHPRLVHGGADHPRRTARGRVQHQRRLGRRPTPAGGGRVLPLSPEPLGARTPGY
ncbi:Beta-lactamase class C-like and penicillin binding proteins (PBPs) superfamily [Kitasatospora purpeofusca]